MGGRLDFRHRVRTGMGEVKLVTKNQRNLQIYKGKVTLVV